MSTKFPGGFITKNYVAPTPAAAPGIWTLDQQLQAQKTGTWPFGGPFNYIEDVFSTYLYTGNGATQTITNGIDLAGKGGLTWIKKRSATQAHALFDTARGVNNYLVSNATLAQNGYGVFTDTLTAFNSTGFSLGADASAAFVNENGNTYASWTFREQPKFFDVVTYTGNGTASRAISHSLGSAPGCMIVKRTDTADGWMVYHRSTNLLILNSNSSEFGVPATAERFGDDTNVIAPTSSVFTLGTNGSVNATGGTYVAYLFAHDAGGFGSSATDNVISCGSFNTGASGGATVNLGYEPQWLMVKSSSNASAWYMFDTMRGWVVGGASAALQAQVVNPEFNFGNASLPANPTATGFTFTNGLFAANETWIYIAIRRGPMKVPTDGTKVFLPTTFVGSNTVNKVVNTNFTVDMTWGRTRDAANSMEDYDRLRGNTVRLSTDLTDAEISSTALYFDVSNGVSLRAGYDLNFSTYNFINYNFARAPGFFDEVCYTGNDASPRAINHNLGGVPDLLIVKTRSATGDWSVSSPLTNQPYIDELLLNSSDAVAMGVGNIQGATSTTFTTYLNTSGVTYVAYLFSTCPGVSKVGKYTGTGATQTINCGFTGGARFVLIKRINGTGGWYTYDTARGMVTGTDPYLFLNSTAAEVNADYVFTSSTGFTIQATAPAAINASGGSYIFLAIA